MRRLVTGGVVVSATDTVRADLLIVDERIAAIGMGLEAEVDQTIDADGRYVIPGGVDVHTHMGWEGAGIVSSDDFASGTAAAAWGGTTTIVDYAGHERGESLASGLARWHAKAAGRSCIDYGFHMMLSEVNDALLAEMGDLVGSGVTSFKLFMAYPGVSMVDDASLFLALSRLAELGALAVVHAESGGPIEVLRRQFVAAGSVSPIFHARSRPSSLEGEATGRAIVLAELAGASLHIAHLSAPEALAMVHAARDRGLPVHAETGPQYLFLSDDDLAGPVGERFVCSPPLRPASSHAVLWQGLRRGDLDVVATDHCPFTSAQKAAGRQNFTRIPNGLPGVEDRLSLVYEGVCQGALSLNRWVEVVATAPAKLFGLYPRKGALLPGADADLVIFNPRAGRTISAGTEHMNVDYSCYEGLFVHGRPELVMQRGRVLVDASGFHGERGSGQFISRGLPHHEPPMPLAAHSDSIAEAAKGPRCRPPG